MYERRVGDYGVIPVDVPREKKGMGDSDYSASLSNLLCKEDGTCLDVEEEEELEYTVSGTEEDQYIETLVSRESRNDGFSSSIDCPMVAGEWLRCARSDAVRWILKTRACFGFSLQTAYLSVTYLDRFFMRRTIETGKGWAIQLLSVACLSLAAKMEECRVPTLSDFRVEECVFDSSSIQRMELLVLNTLEWRMRSITPFSYLNYFASKLLCESYPPKGFLSKATLFICATIEAVNLVEYRPSAIALAAIFAASGKGLTRRLLESKMGFISLNGSLETDHVFSCYNMMIQEPQKEKRIHSSIISSSTYASVNSSVDVTDATSVVTISSKRRRLALTSYSCDLRLSSGKNSDYGNSLHSDC